jgi:outer membrane lipase/esterase
MSIAAVRRSVSSARAVRRLGAVALAASLTLALSACGGGDQVNKFTPGKMVSFGDELSYIGSQQVQGQTLLGQKYGVNYVIKDAAYFISNVNQTDSTTVAGLAAETYASPVYGIDLNGLRFLKAETSTTNATHQRQLRSYWACSLDGRLWTQILANNYGLGYASACPDDKSGAETYAAVGAKVADVLAQFEARRAQLDSSTLVTVWAGQNDVLEQLALVKVTPSLLEAAKAELKARGQRLGQAVNGLIPTGARVLLVTVPDLSKAPGASGYASQLSELTQAFNSGLIGLNGVVNDGTKIGLVKAYDLIKDIAENPSNYGSINTTQAMCNPAALKLPDGQVSSSLLDCVFDASGSGSGSTVSGATITTHLWASDYLLAPLGQAKVGALAFTRLSNNPF